MARQRRLSHPRLTAAQLRGLNCARCGKPFETEGRESWGDDEVPFVKDGIMVVHDLDGTVRHYHGYRNRGCFREELAQGEFLMGDAEADDALGQAVEDAVRAWFAEWGPQGAKLHRVSFEVNYTFSGPGQVEARRAP